MRQLVVLKPSQPMRIANASFKIAQGQIVAHPGYPMPEEAFDIFDDDEKGRAAAQACALKNVQMKNTATRHGVTSRKTLAEALKNEAKNAPTEAARKKAFADAKILTKDGLVDNPNAPDDDENTAKADDESPEEELAKLKKENAELADRLEEKADDQVELNPESYLDQNTRTVVKRVKEAAKEKKLKKEDVEDIIKAEEKDQARIGVLGKLKNFIKNDPIFGKLIR